jgi:Tfp pilus assembly protein PilV
MNTRANRPKDDENGFTLAEVMVAAMLAATFFMSIFELNAMCLRYNDASKESLAALQGVQNRAEALRNLAFSDLTTTSFVRNNVMPANYTPDGSPTLFSKKATEVVRITQYPAANGVTQFTRLPNGTITTDSVATNLGTGLVQVNVSVSWNMTMGGRARTEQTTYIVSNGTKK